ncbi:MAG: TlyA family RNA methyltransferase [Campylobacterota bacterium]|nr:TlyA family RNA methyltransferase [Campylobacterota bacterium]
MRLDNYLVEKNIVGSRNKAQSIIKNSLVSVNESIILKSSFKVTEDDRVLVSDYKEYVSRSAYKLAYFLEELQLNIKDKIALDIGSSTGGFTQVLLENGVKEVSAVDVGRDQLHKTLKDDSRVFSYESCDIRKFHSDKSFEIVVSDVSFISLLNIVDDVERLSTRDIILLFKPQFEVGREVKRDNHGVVLNKKAIEGAMKHFEESCDKRGWELVLKSPSQLTGKEGNLEYCYYFKK